MKEDTLALFFTPTDDPEPTFIEKEEIKENKNVSGPFSFQLKVKVVDHANQPINKAIASLENARGKSVKAVWSGEDGYFETFIVDDPSITRLKVSALAKKEIDIDLTSYSDQSINITLKMGADSIGAVTEPLQHFFVLDKSYENGMFFLPLGDYLPLILTQK